MPDVSKTLQKRQKGRKSLDELFETSKTVNVIQYSSEYIDEFHPRITCIVVRNLENGQSRLFSIFREAEQRHIPINDIPQHYDTLEKSLLDGFYQAVRQWQHYLWVHWNMKDSTYGFEAIQHRYRVVGGDPVIIPDSHLYDLSRILIDIFGDNYIDHYRLPKLMEKNNLSKVNFLDWDQEDIAFKNQNYPAIHLSTERKAQAISDIANKAWCNDLRTNVTWKQMYGSSVQAFLEWVLDTWWFKLVGILATLWVLIDIVQFLSSQGK